MLRRETPGQLYNAKFHAANESGSTESAKQTVPLLLDLIGMRSVCDVGCGVGAWLAVFIDNGVSDVLGLDGEYVDRATLKIPMSYFRPTDLNRPFSLDRTFDAVISLEVAEHLRPTRAAGFINDLTALSSVVIFSAAIPGQGGRGHVNEQWPDYWVNLFKDRGYICVDAIRQKIWENEGIKFWYRQNILVFCNGRILERLPKLTAQSGIMPLRVVHPAQFVRPPGLTFIIKSFPRSLYNAVARRIKPTTSRVR